MFLNCLYPLALLALSAMASATLFAQTTEGTKRDDLLAFYEDLHRHPELSFAEKRTADRVGDALAKAGFDVTRDVGGHGLVAVLANGEGPTLMIRADLDALPITEDTGAAFASTVRTTTDGGREVGVMHACGHDVHMTVLVGTARAMARDRAKWRGTLILVGQPAEERGRGARAMIADGLFERFPQPDHALALHVDANMPAGRVGFCSGAALASVDMVDLVVHGRGGHGAAPHLTIDPIVLSAQIVLALQTLVSREIAPIEPAVVTVGSIHGGSAHNVIPDVVTMQLTCRSYSDEVRKLILDGIEKKAHALADAAGLPRDEWPVMTVRDESIPATRNDPALTKRVMNAARRALGDAHVAEVEAVMVGEDFGVYGRTEARIPTCLYWLGAVAENEWKRARAANEKLPTLHSARFLPDARPTIETGIAVMTSAALDLLGASTPEDTGEVK